MSTSKLGDFLALADSGTWGEDGTPDSGDPVLRSSNIQNGRLDLSDFAWRIIPEKYRQRGRLFPRDIIVTKSSGSANLIGKCCIFDIQAERPYYFSNFTLRLRTNHAVADYRWLYYWLTSERGRAVLAALNTTTTGLRNLNVPRYLDQEIPSPALTDQRRYADILDKADAIRRKRQEAITLTEQLLRSTFLEMFGDPTGETDMTTVAQLAENKTGSIRTGPFGSQLLHSEFTDSGISVLGIDNAVENEFHRGRPRFISKEKYETLRRYTVAPHDLIITIMGTCGRCAIVPDDIPTAINTKHLCCITLDKSKCLPEFLHSYFLFHPKARSYLERSAKGAIMDGLNMGIISQLPVPVVPLERQRRYQGFAMPLSGLKRRLTESMNDVDTLFHSLVQRAFTGQL